MGSLQVRRQATSAELHRTAAQRGAAESGAAVSDAVSEKQLVVGMYAHHQGSGHLNRCRSIARRLTNRGARVEIFSSAPGVHSSSTPHPAWSEQQIPLDFDDPQSGRDEVRDPRAGDTLHWAPLQHPGYRERMAVLAAWIRSARPDVFYVDVSVEVAVFVRLLGVPAVSYTHLTLPTILLV